MKHLFTLALSVLMLSVSAHAYAAEYKIDPTHSFVEFKVKHLGYSWLVGRFNKIEGSFNYNNDEVPSTEEGAATTNKNPHAQSISVTIDTTTIDSNHAERDKHLNKIIGSAEFGTATFESTSYQGSPDGGNLVGNLTLNGETREVIIPIKKIGEGDDPWGGYRVGFEGWLSFDRKTFGIDEDLGPESWNVDLSLYIEGIKK